MRVRRGPERRRSVTQYKATCCEDGKKSVAYYEEADSFYGPTEPGWAISIFEWGYEYRINASFCPFCGMPLGEEKPNDK